MSQDCSPSGGTLHYLELRPEDVDGDVLTPLATAACCLGDLSTREALSVGDSALRSGKVVRPALPGRVALLRNRGAARAGSRLDLLDVRAANAFGSCCRALLIEAGGGGFVPQVTIRHNAAAFHLAPGDVPTGVGDRSGPRHDCGGAAPRGLTSGSISRAGRAPSGPHCCGPADSPGPPPSSSRTS